MYVYIYIAKIDIYIYAMLAEVAVAQAAHQPQVRFDLYLERYIIT